MNSFDRAYHIVCKCTKATLEGVKDIIFLFFKHYSFIIDIILVILVPLWIIPYKIYKRVKGVEKVDKNKVLFRVLNKDGKDITHNRRWLFGVDGSVCYWCEESKSLQTVDGCVVKRVRRKKVAEGNICNTCGSVLLEDASMCYTCGQMFSWEE